MAILVALLLAAPAGAGTPIAGFQDELFALAPMPTGLDFTPDGTLLVTSLTGQLSAVDSAGSTRQIGDLSRHVCLGGERGLYAVAVDPDFEENGFVYLTYNRKRAGSGCDDSPLPANRVSRFRLAEDLTLDAASETVLVDGLASPNRIHNAGDLEFGKDGYLYVTVGDGGCEAEAFQCGPPNRAAGYLHDLRGKILRIDKDGGVPADNPFTGEGTTRCNTGPAPAGLTCQEIWALGFRNPFRFAHDPDAEGVRMFINDVGHTHWEEVNEGHPGANYGWSEREGPCVTGSYTNCPPPGQFTNPIHAHPHSARPKCSSVTGGAFVPAAAWPPPWAGRYIFADYVCNRMFWLRRSGDTWVREPFLTGGWLPIDLKFGPVEGRRPALYYSQLAEFGGSIRRIHFSGPANRPPVAELEASDTRGALDLTIDFDASGSTDPDGDALTYEFDFGDGSPEVVGKSATVTHTYRTKGHFKATVTARDPAGLTNTAEVQIDAGFLPPTIEITGPPDGFHFTVGEPFRLTAEAADPEDVTLDGSSIFWTVLLHHDDHTHPYEGPVSGSSLEVKGPAPEGMTAVDTSYLEVYATATDSDGLRTTVFRRIDPKRVLVELTANLPSAPITVNGAGFKTPATATSWAGWPLEVRAAQSHLLHSFDRWGDGVRDNPRTVTPTSNLSLRANYSLDGLLGTR